VVSRTCHAEHALLYAPGMKITMTSLLASCLVASTALAAPPVQVAAPVPTSHAIYRLDFELTTAATGKPASTTAFSLNLDEHRGGDAMMGDNVPLAGAGAGASTARQNVGVKVKASFEMVGADLLLDVDTELSSIAAPPAVHKIETRGVALAAPGKKTVVASIDRDGVHTQLSVTPTKL
jgi:hypothetical protein